MYRDGEPLAGLQRIFELGAEEKLAEVIIPVEFMSNNNRRVRPWREGHDGQEEGEDVHCE